MLLMDATPLVEDWRLLEPGSAEYFARVLEELNAVRAKYDMPRLDYLPQGRRGQGYRHCALGQALESSWLAQHVSAEVRRGTGLGLTNNRFADKQPTLLCDYEKRFERGEFPALVE